ncbi:unnamed protein product [Blepharisma stoltei]|uniref:Uncharacterized protein n=1 Tax=Blepharisma stoltei TaxID=1481888 RepID=A0AAU9JZ46_9CILI|nr:unnamed protein product [Blepharisma stoltei]
MGDRFLTMNDTQILNELCWLVWRFSNSKENNNIRVRKPTKRRTNHRKSLSFTTPLYLMQQQTDSSETLDFPLKTSHKKLFSISLTDIHIQKQPKHIIYTPQQYSCIKSTFISLLEKYQGTTWVKYNEFQSLIHSVLVKQFFLDCFTFDHSFWALLIEPISSKQWIDAELFKSCLENVQESHNWNLFSPRKSSKKKKTLLQTQKYLFFFSFIEKTAGNELNKENLMEALTMANKEAKYQTDLLLDLIFHKLNESQNYHIKFVNFEQYKEFISGKNEFEF